MNILILSNGAPKYSNFFLVLARKFEEDGAKISFAVDCHTSLDENRIVESGFSYEVFSDYFSTHEVNKEILKKYKKYNLNYALLSDYERASVYKIWGKRSVQFYEKLKSALLCFFEEMLLGNSIDSVLYENVSNSFAYFCWYVCQENSVHYIGLTCSRLPGRFWITDDPLSESNKIDSMLKKIKNGEVKVSEDVSNWCVDYIGNIESIVPDYMKFNVLDNVSITGKYCKLDKLKKIVVGLNHLKDDHYHSYQRGNPLHLSWTFFIRNLKRKLKLKTIRNYYTSPCSGEDFLLYPLHFHPESSTSILSGTYLNEFEVIQNIAFNLPQGVKLYVKDHISAYGYPSIEFYRKLSCLPNVEILAPEAPTKKLIKESKAVITLTSTVGYEALLMGKPVFLFGEVFYKSHKNVIKIENPKNIFEIINSLPFQLDKKVYEYNLKFVSAYLMSTLPGTLNMTLDMDDAKILVSKLYPEINKAVQK